MCEMAPVGEVETHDLISRLQAGQHDRTVGAGATVGLYVRPFRTKQLTQALACDVLHLVHNPAAAVVTLPGKTFSILIGQDGPLCLHDLVTGIILGCNEFNTVRLTVMLLLDQIGNDGIAHAFKLKPPN